MPEPGGAGALWGLGRRAADEGLTFADAWQAIRDAGLSTDRQSFLGFWKAASEASRKADFIAAQGPEYVMGSEAVVDSPLYYSSRFLYKVQVTGTDTTSGEALDPFTIAVGSDVALTKGDVEDLAQQTVEGNPDNYSMDVAAADLLSGEQSQAWVQGQTYGVFDIVPPPPGLF